MVTKKEQIYSANYWKMPTWNRGMQTFEGLKRKEYGFI